MLLGGEIGLDRPQFAEHLRVFSDIFLRLIKVIVAPLIFGTLVTGIAGHGNLRSVGRIGVKCLVYFEIVTTLALFIGLGAIKISRAGEGLTITAAMAATEPVPSAAPLHWTISCCTSSLKIWRSRWRKIRFCRSRFFRCFLGSRGADTGSEARADA